MSTISSIYTLIYSLFIVICSQHVTAVTMLPKGTMLRHREQNHSMLSVPKIEHSQSIHVLATYTFCAGGKYCSGNTYLVATKYNTYTGCGDACLAINSNYKYFDLYFTGSNIGKCFCGLVCGSLDSDSATDTYSINEVSKMYLKKLIVLMYLLICFY